MSTSPPEESPGPEAQIRPSPSVVWRRVEGSVILVHLGTNKTYELNRTGGRLWELLQEGRTYGDALAMLRAEFEIGEEQLHSEASGLIALLMKEQLAEQAKAGE